MFLQSCRAHIRVSAPRYADIAAMSPRYATPLLLITLLCHAADYMLAIFFRCCYATRRVLLPDFAFRHIYFRHAAIYIRVTLRHDSRHYVCRR